MPNDLRRGESQTIGELGESVGERGESVESVGTDGTFSTISSATIAGCSCFEEAEAIHLFTINAATI